MTARDALYTAVGFSAALLVALALVVLMLGSSNQDLQDRVGALQRTIEGDRAKQVLAQRDAMARHETELAKARQVQELARSELIRTRQAAAAASLRAEAAIAALMAHAESQKNAEESRKAEAAKLIQGSPTREQSTAPERPAASKPAVQPSSSEDLFAQAILLEMEGKSVEAVRTYTRAARFGNGKAANRLGEIYDKGIEGVVRDYALMLKWCNTARALGELPNCAAR